MSYAKFCCIVEQNFAPGECMNIQKELEYIGTASNACRTYLFQFHADGTYSNTHEWCNKGIASSKDQYQNVSANDYPWALDNMKKRIIFHIEDVSNIISASQIKHKPPDSNEIRISSDWLTEKKVTIGITAGASTPDQKIEEVIKKIFQIRGDEVGFQNY